MDPVNSAWDPLKKQKSSSLPAQDPQCTFSKKKKKRKKKEGQNADAAFINCIQTGTKFTKNKSWGLIWQLK